MNIRRAIRSDVPAIVHVYGMDPLTGHRELISDPLPECYFRAFDQIDSDANQLLLVAENDAAITGTIQITFIQHLLFQSYRRAVVESLFVHPSHQSQGVGAALMESAIQAAIDSGCVVLELTSNKARTRAHKFYERLGFKATHEGFKLDLGRPGQ